MSQSFVHGIDPIIGTVSGVRLWWYGMAYTVGFANAHYFVRRAQCRLGLTLPAVYDLSLLLAGGVLFGGLLGVWLFCRFHGKPFLGITDARAIPAAFILAMGRIGNFVDGQIVGSVTDVWWAVRFPDAAGFRHPVVLYDALKNLLLIPILWYAVRRDP